MMLVLNIASGYKEPYNPTLIIILQDSGERWPDSRFMNDVRPYGTPTGEVVSIFKV